jgi:hypothetical protein
MTVDLGQLKKMRATELWKHEEHDFTPWLANEENIGRLAETLGLEFQIEGIEVPVGPFSADILAKSVLARPLLWAGVKARRHAGCASHDCEGCLVHHLPRLGSLVVDMG